MSHNKQASLSSYSYLFLLAAVIFLPFINGRFIVPVAAWVAPVFLIRFLRTQTLVKGLLIAYLAVFAAWCANWWGIVRAPGIAFFIVGAVMALIGFLPYLADRLLITRLDGFKSIFVFPTALVSMELLFSLLGPNGSFGSLAYTQYGNLPLMQLVSITGLSGITFLIGWWASTANFAWERRQTTQSVVAAGIFAAAMTTVLLCGGIRLMIPVESLRTVRIAAVSPQYDDNLNYDPTLAAAIQEFLFERSAREAAAGAKIILFPEDSFAVYKQDEPAVLERARQFARDNKVYLSMSYGARVEENSLRYENKTVLVTPSGEIAWKYLKTHAVPGYEEKNMVRGQGVMPTFDTPDGRLASAICYDGDHHSVTRQAGAAQTDLLILPADDWRDITPLHARMAVFRALEEGVSIVRPTMNGLSLAANYRGEVLASMNHFETGDRVMTANIPVTGIRTWYSRIGDLFAYLAVFGLIVLILLGFRRRART